MKVWLVARKFALELLREPQLLLIILSLPLFMLLITWVGYGQTYRLATFPVQVYDPGQVGGPLIADLETARYADGRPFFRVSQAAGRAALDQALKDGSAAVGLLLDRQGITLLGDATSLAYTRASLALEDALGPRLDAQSGRPAAVTWREEPLPGGSPLTEFDAYTPGMMVFAVLLIIPQTAMQLGRELRWGTLRRLRLARVRTWELLAGISLAQLAVGALQVLVLFAAALALGFHPAGSLALALALCLGLTLSSIGLGLVVAGFSRKDSDALNTGSVFSMLQVFLSGAFFAMPSVEIIQVGGHSLGLFDLIPATSGLLALQQVLIGGAGWSQVSFQAGVMLALSVLYFAMGVVIFQRQHMRPGKG